MTSFLAVLHAELLKYKSKTALLFLALPILLAFLAGLQMRNIVAMDPDRGTWSLYVQMICAFWGVFIYTPFAIFLTSQAMQMEARQWKLITIQGVSRRLLLRMKMLALLTLLTTATLVLILTTGLVGWRIGLEGGVPWSRIPLILAIIPMIAPVVAIQMLLATFFRGLLVLLIPALAGHFIGLIAVQFSLGRWLPWSYTLEFLQIRGADAWHSPIYFAAGLLVGGVIYLWAEARFNKRMMGL